jgi:hypothetical protein
MCLRGVDLVWSGMQSRWQPGTACVALCAGEVLALPAGFAYTRVGQGLVRYMPSAVLQEVH